MKRIIYADNAATTRIDNAAFETMIPWLTGEYGNASQPYSFARQPKKAIQEARETIATCIGANPEEIYFTSGGTESDNWAIKGSVLFSKKNIVVTSAIEHHAVLNSCKSCEKQGITIKYLSTTSNGVVLPEILTNVINDNTSLVSVMLANNEIGSIQPIHKLAEIAHSRGAIFHTDAVQAVGHIPVNVSNLGVDLLSASAHKFNGPKGVGFLYKKKEINITAFMDGGAQENGFRPGTENVAGIMAMATALKNNCDKMKSRTAHLEELENCLIERLQVSKIDYIRNGDKNHLPGIISLSFKGISGEVLLHRLDLMGICVSTGSACNSRSTELSHVLNAIGVPKEYAYGTIRISLGHKNTFEEVIFIADSIKKILDKN